MSTRIISHMQLIPKETLKNGLTALMRSLTAFSEITKDGSYEAGYIAGKMDAYEEIAQIAGVTLEGYNIHIPGGVK